MSKWTVDVWDRSNGATLLNDGGICAAFPSADAAKEIARKLNAFDEMLEALKELVQRFGWEYPNFTKQAEAAITKAEGE